MTKVETSSMPTVIHKKPVKGSKDVNANGENVRSKFEMKLTDRLAQMNIPYEYEAVRIPFTPPAKVRHYTPDVILPNGLIIEIKGRFMSDDRQKHKYIKAQYPDLDIRFVFMRATQKITKTSKTSYGDWCRDYGFKFAEGVIPKAWIEEPTNEINLKHIKEWKECTQSKTKKKF